MRRIIFTVLFSAILLTGAGAQDLNQVVSFADEQFQKENYDIALKEYQRAVFFGMQASGTVYSKMADCSFQLHKYDQAIEYYDRAFFSFSEDSLKHRAILDKAKCSIVTKNYNIALIDLLGITDSLPEKQYRLKQFYIGICYYGTEQFNDARMYFIDAVNPSFVQQREAIQQAFEDKKMLNRPNPHTASIMSICFPGLGQFYAGDIKNGVNSFVLSTALVFLGVNIAVNQTIWDGIFTVMPWFQRYYQGGYMRAEKIAYEKRAANRDKVYQKVFDAVISTK